MVNLFGAKSVGLPHSKWGIVQKKWRVYMHIRARIHKYMTGGHRVIGIKDSHSMVSCTHWNFGATSVLSVLCRFSNNISNMCQCLASLVLAPGLIVRCIKMITTQYWMDLASCLLTVFCCSRVNGLMDMAKDRNIFARMHETSFFSQFFCTLYVIHLYEPIEHYMY